MGGRDGLLSLTVTYFLVCCIMGRWLSKYIPLPLIFSHCASCRISLNPGKPFICPRIWFQKLLQWQFVVALTRTICILGKMRLLAAAWDHTHPWCLLSRISVPSCICLFLSFPSGVLIAFILPKRLPWPLVGSASVNPDVNIQMWSLHSRQTGLPYIRQTQTIRRIWQDTDTKEKTAAVTDMNDMIHAVGPAEIYDRYRHGWYLVWYIWQSKIWMIPGTVYMSVTDMNGIIYMLGSAER